ncbi:EDIL3 [Bugula neritina]|uniref:EDIL3 n=1 Tax=Bugula neritina TaxID=10212 RepID=A0A7J7IYV3_BUGNE|nr:EDIL3 [Bugula neritina]
MAVSTGWGASGEWVITNPHGKRKGAWSPKYAVSPKPGTAEQYIYGQWIQIDFAKPTLIQSVTTKGSATALEFITEYYLEFSYDNPKSFEPYTTPAAKKPFYFAGNNDSTTAVTRKIEFPFEAQYVRLRPRKFYGYPSLRWALNGCPPPKYCEPERLVTGESQLSDWTIKTSSLKDGSVYDSRLTALPGGKTPNGWLAALPNAVANTLSEQWIQIYLMREMLVHGIVTKGHKIQPYWVKSYQIQTRSVIGGYRFYNYQEPYGTIKTFQANTDQDTEVTNMLGNPIVATYVRDHTQRV